MTIIIYKPDDPRYLELIRDDRDSTSSDDFDYPMSYSQRRLIAWKYDGVDLPPLAEDVEYEREMARIMAAIRKEAGISYEEGIRLGKWRASKTLTLGQVTTLPKPPAKPPPPKPRPAPPISQQIKRKSRPLEL